MRFLKNALNIFGLAAGLLASLLVLPLSSSAQIAPNPPSLAPILNTRIFVQSDNPSGFEYVTFNAPEAGKAILRVVNGAKEGDSDERFESGEIILNNRIVVTSSSLNKNTNVFETPVPMQKGANRLVVKLPAKHPDEPAKRLSLCIDAPADKIVMTPVINPIVLGKDPLKAQAKVTGLGMPVPEAEVQFEVHYLEANVKQSATTGDTGVATAYLNGFGVGKGKLLVTLAEYGLSDSIPVEAINKRTITIKQRPDTLRLETDTSGMLVLRINILEVVNDKDLIKIAHFIKPAPGGDPAGILISSDFPLNGHVVERPGIISSSAAIKGVTPGRYIVTSTATVTDTGAVKIRESFSTELMVEVVKTGAPDPLILNKPLISPSAIPPASEPTQVAFGTSIVSTSTPPEVLYLDEVSNKGEIISEAVAELRDDGKDPDKKQHDHFYSTAPLKLSGDHEMERYFRLRAKYFGETVVSGIAVFPITKLQLGFRPSNPQTLVVSADGQDKLFANEVIVGTLSGVSPRRIQTILAEVGDTLGLKPGDIGIAKYIPAIDAYLVEFEGIGHGTLQDVNRVIAAFKAYEEVAYASPNFQGRLAAPSQWFLEHIGIDQLRLGAGNPGVGPPVYGSNSIGVAVHDSGVDCNNADLSGKCAAAPSLPAECSGIFTTINTGSGHGTKVAALVAGQGDNLDQIFGVDGGVAWDTKLFPFLKDSTWALDTSINCAQNLGAAAAIQLVHILNVSIEQNPSTSLQNSVCNAICNNILLVAAAGNYACSGDVLRYPASYNDDGTSCSCGAAADRILNVGATDVANNRGDKCPGLGIKSQPGEIYAPGWGLPSDNNVTSPISSYGTSWSTPLVAGCAAVRGAVQEWQGVSWDANAVETRLRNNAVGSPPLLNCSAAVQDPYDLVFVLDRSGSMGLTTNIDTSVAADRWDALKIAVNGFTPLISASAPPDSNFGLTLFASTVLPDTLSGLIAIDSNLPTNVSTNLVATPSGTTAMGLGLKDGIAKMNPLRPRVIVLFTDGEQNIPPEVDISGCTYSDSSLVNLSCPGGPGSVKIIAVGIGGPSGPYLATLQALASKNRGSLIITDNGTDFTEECTGDLNAAFDCAIAPALYGNSPQMVASYKGTLTNTVTLVPFDLNKDVTQLLIKMSFSQNFKIPELLSVLAGVHIIKDKVDITRYFQPVFTGNLTNSILFKTNFVFQKGDKTSTISPKGSYTVQMTAPASQKTDLGYRVVPFADDHRLKMDWWVSPLAPSADKPFNPTISLSWAGVPVTNAIVEAKVIRPGDDLGDLLAKHPLKIDPIANPDAGSPGYQKYLALVKNDSKFLEQLRPDEQQLTLTHQGNGQYSASYNPGPLSGIFQIVYLVSVKNDEFGKIQRKAVQSIYTRFGDVDLDNSAVNSTVQDKTVTINFRPITTYGRLIGPAQGNGFSVTGDGIKLSGITDHQDGSYTLSLTGNPDAEVFIKLLGGEIYRGKASELGKSKGAFERLLHWLTRIIAR